MKKNRIFAVALAALLSVSAFTACGSKKEEKKDETAKPLTPEEQLAQDMAELPEKEDENNVDPATKEEAKKLADEITKRARDGEDFYSLVEAYGEDPGMYNNPEGYLFTYGAMVPEFEEASFKLKVGEISDPVETTYGYHIIKKLPLDLDPASKEYLDIAYMIGGEKLNAELEEFLSTVEVVYTDAFNSLGILDMGTPKATEGAEADAAAVPTLSGYDWKYDASEVMFTIGTAPVTFGEFRYYAMGNKPYVDGGDDSYWTEENTETFKKDIVEQFKQFVGIKLLATSEKYGIELDATDEAKINDMVTSYKVQFGEEGLASLLDEMFVDEEIFRYMLRYDQYVEKVLLANAPEAEIMAFAEENYVRVQHVLVSFTQEEAAVEEDVAHVHEENAAEPETAEATNEDTVVEAAE